ncbi:MAG: TVP38/TMEM64 family protein [Pyrinomonadaceae bacterium]
MSVKIGLTLKRICLFIWIAIPITCLSFYLYDPQLFTPEHIAEFLLRFKNEILILYVGISIMRGFTLLPSTPLVIAGTLIYPNDPLLVMIVSMTGILLSSSLIYYFSEVLGFTEFFERKRPQFTQRIRSQMERPWGILFVFLWAFFPLVPTDAVCYVAGTIRMTFWKFIAAIFFGELILCSFYIFSGHYVLYLLA